MVSNSADLVSTISILGFCRTLHRKQALSVLWAAAGQQAVPHYICPTPHIYSIDELMRNTCVAGMYMDDTERMQAERASDLLGANTCTHLTMPPGRC